MFFRCRELKVPKILVVISLTVNIFFFVFGGEELRAKSFLWEIKSDKSSAYILGSIHMANASFYPLQPAIEDAFRASEFLVVEVNPLKLDQAAMAQQILEKGLYKSGENAKQDLTPETLELLRDYLQKNNIPMGPLLKMRPTFIALTLSAGHLMKMGFTPDQGIDMYFSKKAAGKKEILELESMEKQLDLLFSMPNEDGFLRYTLLDMENIEKLFQQMVGAWKSGDHETMEELVLKPYDKKRKLEPIMERLFYERNVEMVENIVEMMNEKKSLFIVVGAGHLVGDKGIVELLRNNGLTVKQL